MQATVASYDGETGSGTVVTDKGQTHPFGPEALAEHIRHLRAGQRVHVASDASGITGIRLWT